jgi:serine/threonine-protein kinase RsbT
MIESCSISQDSDVVKARQAGRRLAEQLGFSRTDQALIATAISELARNIVNYADSGVIQFEVTHSGRREGIQVCARDKGPGIPDVELAMTDGYSTGKSLGLGLPGTRRIVDEFRIASEPGKGVTVTFVKWKPK